jgi:D-3-phosphoglycerate dehydrogenase
MQVELPQHEQRLRAAGFELVVPELTGQQFTEDELIAQLPDVVGMIAGDDPLSRRVIESTDSLRVIIRWGIGMDSVDHQAARDNEVFVTNTPAVFGDEVADSAFGYVLLLARGHHVVHESVRNGGWPKYEGITLAEQTLGVIGFGSIGRAICKRGLGFGMRVLAFDPYADPTAASAMGVDLVPLDEVLAASRFVVLASPLTTETHHIIDVAALAKMRTDAFIVNVGRGPLVDEAALTGALAEGRIAGAGLDVFEVEPLPADSPLRGMPQVILGAHNGSNTRQGVARASAQAVERLLTALGDSS